MSARGRFKLEHNVKLALKDRYGRVKQLFQFNKLGAWLFKHGLISAFNKSSLFGSYSDEVVLSNLVTTVGKAKGIARVFGIGSVNAFNYIAIGTSGTAATVADTTLGAEISTNGGQRASSTNTATTTDTTNDTAHCTVTFTFTGSFTILETGLFNAASTGDMFARAVMASTSVQNGDQLQVNWDIDAD